MNPQDPLAALHPLRNPEAIGWWPFAPGWWMLLTLMITAIALGGWWAWRRYRRNEYRRTALTQLESLASSDTDSPTFLADLTELLKSVALCAFPPREVAAKHGHDWWMFLNRSVDRDDLFAVTLADSAYRCVPHEFDRDQLAAAARFWIRHHRSIP
ncbi:MAG: DUF4381 domain-containing protein [Pseudomonadota bacterium]